MQKQLDSYKRINQALTAYLSQLEQIDIARYRKEAAQYNEFAVLIEKADSEEELNIALKKAYKALGLELPYKGDFDEFMRDKSNKLVFK